MQSDYDFKFGGDRHLRGHGVKGLVALALLLVALVLVTHTAGGFTASGFNWLRMIVSRSADMS